MNVIPSIDLVDGDVVRLIQGDPKRLIVYDSNPIKIANKWVSQGASRLHLVDIDAALGRGNNNDLISNIVNDLKIPVQVGGGVRSFTQASNLLNNGVDRVIVGTMAFKDESALDKLLTKFDSNRVSIALDHRDSLVMIEGWAGSSGTYFIKSLNNFLKKGLVHFLITSITTDGMLKGPDVENISIACKVNGVKISASGGIRNISDLNNLKKVGADSAIVGRSLYESKLNLSEAIKKIGDIENTAL